MVAESLALMPLRARDNISRVKAERNELVFILLVKVEGQRDMNELLEVNSSAAALPSGRTLTHLCAVARI